MANFFPFLHSNSAVIFCHPLRPPWPQSLNPKLPTNWSDRGTIIDNMSNFGAITTRFTPSAGCSAPSIYLFATEGRQTYIQAPTNIDQCFPRGYDPGVQTGHFSPAQCPMGYTAACISLNTIGPDVETVMTCCPSYPSTMFACNTPEDRYPWQSSLGCTSAFSPMVTLTSISVSMSGVIGSLPRTTESTGGMNAYSVQVRFKSDDFPATTTITKTMHTTSTTTLPVPGVTTTVPAREIDLGSPSAVVGAACMAAVFGLVLLLIGACFFVRRICSCEAPYDRFGPQDPQESPLLAGGSTSYQTAGGAGAHDNRPPPPYVKRAPRRARHQ
ncbi:hypothetical protein B0H67DRAFT_98952 [Lasiosphaeris hirsuta]|uniref:Uncharacterized protein n=1 Tax=Lasiosphaeris hirsuta TaxID=260670 RepID=A0AA40AXW3_9PEZI|nr:hypothetical protein B0H67DRAFT_98952 [Lasiosphaeris hirsuta]